MDMYKYRRKLGSESAMDAIAENTKLMINQTFHEAPNYRKVLLNGVEVDSRVSIEEKETKREFLFRPETEVNKGDIIIVDDSQWLTINSYATDIYPTSFADFCNQWLRWKNDLGEIVAYPCVVEAKTFDDLEEGKYVIISENTITILVQYNEDTKNIKATQRFIINDKPFQIDAIDTVSHVSLGKGIIEMIATEDLKDAEDNVEDQIADNNESGWGGW